MKKTLLIFVVLISTIFTGHAQLTEGKVNYNMEFSSDDPDMAMGISMMEGSKLDIYFKNENTRADVSMGSFMNMSTIGNANTKEILMLMNFPMMGMKYAVKSNTEEVEAQSKKEVTKLDVTLADETKNVLGYKCKKAIGTNAEGNKTVFWYTEDIKVNKQGQSYLYEEIPGFPLEFEMMQQGMLVTITARAFEDLLDENEAKILFSMEIPEGYDEKTFEELQQMGEGK